MSEEQKDLIKTLVGGKNTEGLQFKQSCMALEAPLTEELRADLQQMMVAEPCSFMSSAPAETFVEDPRRASFGSVASKRSLPETAAAGTPPQCPRDKRWSLQTTTVWLAANGDLEEWQEAFWNLNSSGDAFLGIGGSSGGLYPYTRLPRVTEDMQFDNKSDEKSRCPQPRLLGAFKDSKAQILTHQLDRPEKCPISIWEYHVKGFARKYDRSGHTADTF